MIDISPDQRKQLQAIADTLGDNLGHAWNYIGTLDALGVHAKLNHKLFITHSHFISTVVYAIWDALFLKLHHCADRHRRAYGFPKLFRLIRHYLPDDTGLLKQVTEDERSLRCGDATVKIEHWRNEMVAHHTHDEPSFRRFYESNSCKTDDIRPLVQHYQDMLNRYAIDLLNLGFRPDDMAKHARPAVDAIVEKLE